MSQKPILKQFFIKYLSEIPKNIFSKTISSFHSYITLRLLDKQEIDPKIAYATRVLGFFDAANEKRQDPVEHSQFYNDGVNNNVHFLTDYKRHRAMSSKVASGEATSFREFSFLSYPFILSPASKAKYLEIDATLGQEKEFAKALLSLVAFTALPPQIESPLCDFEIDRENLLQSAVDQITLHKHELKKKLRVKFKNEQGVDAGGVKKEFFQLVVKKILDVQFGMFTYDHNTNFYWFNPNSFEDDSKFQLIGTIIGVAIYNNVILDIRFPMVVYKKMLGYQLGLNDLKELDPQLGKSLEFILQNQVPEEELTFSFESECFGEITTIDLIPNGRNIFVNEKNKKEYVDAFVKYKLTTSIQKQFDAFLSGFKDVVAGVKIEIFKIFKPEELELLICGSKVIDFEELERMTIYQDFDKNSQYICGFWRIVHSLSLENKKKFLEFCTGSDRVPIEGLKGLKFVVQRNGDDSEHLPTSITCFNVLLLPEYASIEKLEKKLLVAIQNSRGFGLQ